MKERIRFKPEMVFLSFLLAGIVFLIINSIGWSQDAKIVPWLVLWTMLGLTLIAMYHAWRKPEGSVDTAEVMVFLQDHYGIVLWMIGLWVFLQIFGYVIGIPLFIFFYGLAYKQNLVLMGTLAVMMGLITYFAFQKILAIPLPVGVILDAFEYQFPF